MKTCATCKWFKLGSALSGLQPGQGVCFRFPPSSNGFAAPGGVATVTTRPSVYSKDEACGEHAGVVTIDSTTLNGTRLKGIGD